MGAFLNNRILQHTLFWVAHVVFYAVIYGSYFDNYTQTFYEELIFLPPKIFFTYAVLYYLLPDYLLPGKYVQFFIGFTVAALIGAVATRYIAFNFDYPIYFPEALKDSFMYFPKIAKMVAGLLPPMFIAVAIKLLKYWYANQQAQKDLLQEKLEAELKFLKTQIHPHFLFNTLNNLYALTLKKSDLAPAVVLKLSELINYMLYECHENLVPLEKEVKFIYNYVDIEQLRYGDKLDVDIRLNGDVGKSKIAPLLLLPFVENCFKHGASLELEQSWVKIDIDVQDDQILFKVENNKGSSLTTNGNQGIGITNVRRRLDLLYNGDHELKIINGNETFLVILSINKQKTK